MPGQVGRPRKNIDLTDAAQTVVTDVEHVAGEVASAAASEAPAVVTEVAKEVGAAALGVETPADAEQHVVSDLEHAAETAVAPIKDAVTEASVEGAIDGAEHVALKAGEALVDSRLPAAAPVLNVVEPEIEHVAFHVTNVVTTDFAHRAETYIIALEKSVAEKLHTTALLDRLAAAIKNDLGGIPILASALHVTEVKKNVKGIAAK